MDGFEAHMQDRSFEFQLVPPADCAKLLARGQSQMALIPVGAMENFHGLHLMPNFCIGSNGPVESVFIFSEVPITEARHLILDSHSRSSNGLAQILLRHHWKHQPGLELPTFRDFSRIQGQTAGVVIGDKAIHLKGSFPYEYDLSQAWKELTGLPFAFAVWAYQPGVFSKKQLAELDEAMRLGVARRAQTAQRWAEHYGTDPAYAAHYLQHCIDFHFDGAKHKAVNLYLQLLQQLPKPELQLV